MNSKPAKVLARTPLGNRGDRRSGFALSDDILMEILILLPAKSVIRFKSVCKHWLSLASSAEFGHLHALRYPKMLILKASDSQFFSFDPIMNGEKAMVPYTFPVPNPRVVSSCNGLMLLQSPHADKSFHVYNPTTKQSREISVMDGHSDNEPYVAELSLAFDPLESPHYKVVCIRSTMEVHTDPYDEHIYQIEVYDSESCTWSLSLGPFTFPRELLFHGTGVYWNGAIYWPILHEIGYYDIGKKEFETLSRPKYPPGPFRGMRSIATECLQEANGRLYQSELVTRGNSQSIELFELDMNDRSSWLLKYDETISEHERTASVHSFAHQLRLIAGAYGTEACGVLSRMSGKISVHSFVDKSYKLLVDLSDQPFFQEDSRMEMYEFVKCKALV